MRCLSPRTSLFDGNRSAERAFFLFCVVVWHRDYDWWSFMAFETVIRSRNGWHTITQTHQSIQVYNHTHTHHNTIYTAKTRKSLFTDSRIYLKMCYFRGCFCCDDHNFVWLNFRLYQRFDFQSVLLSASKGIRFEAKWRIVKFILMNTWNILQLCI